MRADVGLRVAVGMLELAWPNLAARTDRPLPEAMRWGSRILGVRNLAQAGLVAVRPTAGMRHLAVAVDLTHAASMVAYARFHPARRGACLSSAALAALLAGVSYVAAYAASGVSWSRR